MKHCPYGHLRMVIWLLEVSNPVLASMLLGSNLLEVLPFSLPWQMSAIALVLTLAVTAIALILQTK